MPPLQVDVHIDGRIESRQVGPSDHVEISIRDGQLEYVISDGRQMVYPEPRQPKYPKWDEVEIERKIKGFE